MSELSNLSPQNVFSYFDEICSIPRASGQEQRIAEYLCEFAVENNLQYVRDELNNVLIKKPASAGYEDKEPVILQGHMDMVCVFAEGANDPAVYGVAPVVEDGYIFAEGASLGADDGIGMAMILAILADDNIEHPAIEAVFTTQEEVGLSGAAAFDTSVLTAKRLINIDNEAENELVIGCAGGVAEEITINTDSKKAKGVAYEIKISGLKGGHSGTDIDKGRANANVLLGKILGDLVCKVDYGLVSACGGQRDNAIAIEAQAKIVIDKEDSKILKKAIKEYGKTLLDRFAGAEPDMCIEVFKVGKEKCNVIKNKDLASLIVLMGGVPNGVVSRNKADNSIVETSLNFGTLHVSSDLIRIVYSLRSCNMSDLNRLKDSIEVLAVGIGASAKSTGAYPAWEPKIESDFAIKCKNIYEREFNKALNVITIHAGLECAAFAQKIDELDAISIGPDLEGAHSISERLSVESVQNVWRFLIEILKD